MGANQSKPSDAAIQEKLIERLQALQVKDDVCVNEKEGYVCVENNSSKQPWNRKQTAQRLPED
jgi:bleomycin hydrolase